MKTLELLNEVDNRAEHTLLLLHNISDALQIIGIASEGNAVDITAFTCGFSMCLDIVIQEALKDMNAIVQVCLSVLSKEMVQAME